MNYNAIAICKPPYYTEPTRNVYTLESTSDIRKLVTQCITDQHVFLERRCDGSKIQIIKSSQVYPEVYNQTDQLLAWVLGKIDEFPDGGEYARASI